MTISTFRKEAGKCLDNILTQVITAIVAVGVVDLEEVVLDGTKTKANVGRGSFHTKEELEELKKEISDKLDKIAIEEQKINHKSRLDNQEKRIQKALDQIRGIQEALNESAKKRKKGHES